MAVVSCRLDSPGENYFSSASLRLARGVDEALTSRESRSVSQHSAKSSASWEFKGVALEEVIGLPGVEGGNT
jgi:hypothetical protein